MPRREDGENMQDICNAKIGTSFNRLTAVSALEILDNSPACMFPYGARLNALLR